jgi:hypothetical protein
MNVRDGMQAVAPDHGGQATPAPAVEEFVRFCYHRRRVGWPELYDEMCAVAAKGVFRGWGFSELADQGICFTLSDLPGLAAVAADVSRDERERRRRAAQAAATADRAAAAPGDREPSPVVRLHPVGAGAD